MVRPLRDRLDVVFDLCYYMHQDFNTVMNMYVFDIDWMHDKLIETLKKAHRDRVENTPR